MLPQLVSWELARPRAGGEEVLTTERAGEKWRQWLQAQKRNWGLDEG